MLRDLKRNNSPWYSRWSLNRCTNQKTLKHTGMFLCMQSTLSFEPTGWVCRLQVNEGVSCGNELSMAMVGQLREEGF